MEKQKIIQNIQENPSGVVEWLSALTDLEQKIVALLYQRKQSMFVKQILRELLKNTYLQQIGKNDSVSKYPFIPSLELIEDFVMDEDLKQINNFFQESQKKNNQNMNKYSFNNFLKFIEGNSAIKLPSQRRIKECCETLVDINLLLSRQADSKKTKKLYFLNPNLRAILDKHQNEK